MTERPDPSAGKVGHGFGTAPVFLASISTILGAVLFLRFGYAAAHAGLWGSVLIILIGHAVTIPTALAIAEIATNRRVEGGGEYFIISRSFGTTIGATIGIALYLSQAVSVAFYMIAFAEAFRPLAGAFESATGIAYDPRFVSLPGTILLGGLVLTRGADLGVRVLWAVSAVIFVSLTAFFVGGPVVDDPAALMPLGSLPDADPFILVFAIVFPAFTGMTAGVGLSGDLANPRRSIPVGVLTATLAGMAIYIAVIIKLVFSASPELLGSDPLVMSRVAIWGPIIPIGLACATVSSAIGSILVAPRTLQALAVDRVVPLGPVNRLLAHGVGAANDPRNATLITLGLATVTVAGGNIDFVARMISMFFMVTYGSLCAISFLEHFAARPSYRPSFRSRWYVSLIGAVACGLLMFQMDPLYAIVAALAMAGLYGVIRSARHDSRGHVAALLHGVMTQATRRLQILLQKSDVARVGDEWRPSLIMINSRTFTHSSPMQLFNWLSHRYGFGTYLHFIEGSFDQATYLESRKVMPRLIKLVESRRSAVYVDTIISPSMRSALTQAVQLPGTAGMENNSILFEISKDDSSEVVEQLREGCAIAATAGMNRLVLRHGSQFFGARSNIHVWLTWNDERNASLMILLAYILLGHRDWAGAEISIFAGVPNEETQEQAERVTELVTSGRLPISPRNIRVIPVDGGGRFDGLVESISTQADLVILGFNDEQAARKKRTRFERCPALRDTLFVSAREEVVIGG